MPSRALALALGLLLALSGSAKAISGPTLQAKLTREMRRAGASSGAFVRDLDAKRMLFASKADVPRAPGSVEKLYTTSTALLRFGPDATFETDRRRQRLPRPRRRLARQPLPARRRRPDA